MAPRLRGQAEAVTHFEQRSVGLSAVECSYEAHQRELVATFELLL